MTSCRYQDHPDRLGRLLSGDSPGPEQARLAAHLETCHDCRRALDALAARSGLWDDLALLRDHDLEAPTRDFPTDPEKEPRDDEEVPLGLLEPAEEPGHLGKLGPYDILRVVGRGGMGVVFQARDRALDRLVAIKVLTPGMAATGASRRRFAREAKAAAAVVHEHVVTIHAVDVTPRDIPYLVMQYIAGKSVQDLIDQGRPPELCEILRIGSQAAGGLAAAHAQGLIHRDIKPANLLLEDGVERVKITDFGLARAVDDATMSQSGVVAGTPQYMSPEQARGDAFDHRTDLFSLGSVLYALCTGRSPFRGSSSMATLKRVCERAPEPIGSLNPDIPAWLVKIIARLHAKDPGERHATAGEVAELLGRCLAHVQQPASVPLPVELMSRPKRRSFAAWGTLSLCMLLAASLTLTNVRAAAQDAADYVATVLRLKTPEGVLVVETDDPGIGIKLDGSELVVTGAGVKELRLAVGPHNVQALKDGKILREELVTITRGGRSVLAIRREADEQSAATARTDRPAPSQRLSDLLVGRPPGPRRGAVPEGAGATRILGSSAPSLPGAMVPVVMHPRAELEAIGSEVRSVACSTDGRILAYGTKDGRIGLWHQQGHTGVGPGGEIHPPFDAHPGGVESVAFAPDGKTLASGGWDRHVKLWDIATDPSSPRLIWDFPGHDDGVRSVAFSPDGTRLVAGGFDRVATVLEARTGLRDWTSPKLEQPINGVQFSPDGRVLALALGDYSKGIPGDPVGQPGEVQLWSWPGRKPIATMRDWARECKTVAFSPDGKLLAATGGDGTTRLYEYDGDSCKEKAILRSGPFTAGAAFRPDGRLLATSNWSGQVSLWEPSNGGLRAAFRAHDANIPSLVFTPDGQGLATASADGSIKLWDATDDSMARPSEIREHDPAHEVRRLAEVLKGHPPRPSESEGFRVQMQLYMRDLVDGGITLIADEPAPGLTRTSMPSWSNDGRRIAFHATPDNDWQGSQMMILEVREGKPSFRRLGPGSCPAYSPDDRRIAFLQWPGSVSGPEGGVWVMNADGTERRRVAEFGAPSWSPQGDQLMINNFSEPTECRLLDLATGSQDIVQVPGHHLMSWPRWVDRGRLVAVISTGQKDEAIVLLDVSTPAAAKIVRVLWKRGPELDVLPRWPLYRASTGRYYFVGVEPPNKRNLYDLTLGEIGRAVAMQPEARRDQLEGLSLSPDDRYLLFNANRPERR